ncbi:MAG: sirohydrochlorin chelatase, partial [Candidatus Hinthialibacter sp.]
MTSHILLLIAHGSRSSAWNHAIETLCSHLQQIEQSQGGIDEVHGCYLEYAPPAIPAALDLLCQENERDIICLPLFLSAGLHVAHDIPNEIGLAAEFVERRQGVTLYERRGCRIQLLDPPPALDLLAGNIERRVKQMNVSMNENGLIVVYYGSQKYMRQWNQLALHVQSKLAERFPRSRIAWSFAGQAGDFSPVSLADSLQDMARYVDRIVIIPALVAVGFVQNEIIPAAVAMSQLSERIVYAGDAILPDAEIERSVLD